MRQNETLFRPVPPLLRCKWRAEQVAALVYNRPIKQRGAKRSSPFILMLVDNLTSKSLLRARAGQTRYSVTVDGINAYLRSGGGDPNI